MQNYLTPPLLTQKHHYFILFSIMLTVRFLFAHYQYFWEQDDISIAAGVAGLVRDNIGDAYRYGPQVGYYRLVELLDLVIGGNPADIPVIMISLSVIAGALIPFLALFAFREQIKLADRQLIAFTIFLNPVLWTSSRYGNTGIVALAFAIIAIVLLSNRPRKGVEFFALFLFGFATLVRADTILLTPLFAYLVYSNHRAIIPMLLRGTVLGLVMAAIYLLLILFDPRMDNILSTTGTHLVNTSLPTHFWEYLFWSFSPLPFLFAIFGTRDLLFEQHFLIKIVLIWCIPVFLFYFGSTTTPRYFLLVVFPISICTVFGLRSLANQLGLYFRQHLVWLSLLTLSSLHLFIGFGHFTLDRFTNILTNAYMETHDGKMYTGGFIYHGGILHQAIKNKKLSLPRFGEEVSFHIALTEGIRKLSTIASSENKVIIVINGWNGHGVHFITQVAGAKYLSRLPSSPEFPFSTETWMQIGNVKVMTISGFSEIFDTIDQLNVEIGDEIWDLGDDIEKTIQGKIPDDFSLVQIESPGDRIRAFKFVKAKP